MDAKPSRKGCHPANRISSPSARKAIHPDILLPADEISRALCYNIRMRPRAYNGGPAYAPRPALLKWLLDSDPALRWQVVRDLTDESPNTIAVERSRVLRWSFARAQL